ncbi:glycoside hydrolase family 3 C-terminal domain-containing protein [Demequina sp. NBRC 110055]|uniref:glycoside hydrolase family 3 C-terminal domain-containing protein n=1 Tax=Demequina sp. NBRC 110055 TaxID=1570344 RepID=UPI001F4343B2|nr:glycoside hydrolase family 3 C-terminal domain-containing protein [Demequina sp. NBRC 110055]
MIAEDLTVREKIALLVGADFWSTSGVTREGVEIVEPLQLADGPHGVRKQPTEGDHLGIGNAIPATCFPPAVTLGSTWDRGMARRVGAALGAEAAARDVDVLLGPGVNIKRSPLGGRNFEYFSEDPVLAGDLAAEVIAGIQEQGVAASLKHFAVNNQETDRMRISADVDERALREVYLEAFRRAIEGGRPWTVMSSYNKVNGEFVAESRALLTDVLRGEWGFDGAVVSDWGGVSDRTASLKAGLDLQMPGPAIAGREDLERALESGEIDELDLDASVRRILALTERTRRSDVATVPDDDAHHRLARDAAERGMVLLRNDPVDDGPVLPLDPSATGVLIVGELARSPRLQGSGSSQVVPTRRESPLDELRARFDEEVAFEPGYSLEDHDDALADAACAAATRATTVVLFLGLPENAESEGYDRPHLDLPAAQVELAQRLLANHSRVVIVLQNGAPVVLSSWADTAPAIVEMWLAGQAGGSAITRVLTGDANPSGRLAETIPLRLEDTSAFATFPGEAGHVRHGEGVFVGYRHHDLIDGPVGFPFGHGLSYTAFEYGNVAVRDAGEKFRVTATITNTGDRFGAEVVQLYVGVPDGDVRRAPRELKAFARVELDSGESANVEFALERRDFAYWDVRGGKWKVDGGRVSVWLGSSSRDLRSHTVLDVEPDVDTAALDQWASLSEALRHPVVGPRLRDGVSTGAYFPMSEDLERMAGDMPLRLIADFEGMLFDRAQLAGLLDRQA